MYGEVWQSDTMTAGKVKRKLVHVLYSSGADRVKQSINYLHYYVQSTGLHS